LNYPLKAFDDLAIQIQKRLSEYHKRSSALVFQSDHTNLGSKLSEESASFMAEASAALLSEIQRLLAETKALLEGDEKTIRDRVSPIIKQASFLAEHPTNPLGYNELAKLLMDISGQLKVRAVYRPKVFVGHSFKKEDEQVVMKFLNFFYEQGFDYVTGERPEASNVDDKVKYRIAETEGTIVLCTKEEKLEHGGWSVSTWLIGENAYAMGLGKNTALFFEDQVHHSQRKGIQGDMEYIEFNRENPSAAFVKSIPYLQDFKQRIVSAATKK
jgi:hypothetical protein